MNIWIRRFGYGLLALVLGATLFIASVVTFVQVSRIGEIDRDQMKAPYAIVLGASVKQDGTPSDALYDRIVTAVELYNDKQVEKLLMTGDDGKFHTNEVEVMKKAAMELGVPQAAIDVDGEGYRTYESCKRAKQVLHINEAIIVTQRFHLGRAMYLCDRFGITTQGRSADRQSYQRILFFWARDLTASFKAWWDINVQEPKPPVDASERD